ncbi:MAG: hypothetical protein NXI04_06240 [Planctomycetaceae bacterium]|nr:hypothetical protein [Planctomycetaceae bacterium]
MSTFEGDAVFPEITVRTGARLHFGLLCTAPDSPWHYGGIGVMLNQPGWAIRCQQISSRRADLVAGGAVATQRVTKILQQFRRSVEVPRVRLVIDHLCPFHAGLGSGTQLTLAVAMGLHMAMGQLRPASASEVAVPLGRMRRSGIGTFGFDRGGFIIDHGRSCDQADAFTRLRFPEDWKFVLLRPAYLQGLHGAAEETFFEQPRYLESSTIRHVEQLINREFRGALTEHQFARFAAALAEYGNLVGRYFAPAQGGIFSCDLFAELVERLNAAGFVGAAQSSWGPSIAVPAESAAMAADICQVVTEFDVQRQIHVSVTGVSNIGATVMSPAPADYRSFG